VPEPAVQVTSLVKRYGQVEAVRGISFEVQPGETFGFLGPNGAGKSTTIKILCTLANPTSGGARVAGYDVVRQRDTVRRNIGLVFQDPTLDSYLTGEQNLRFHADLYGVPRSQLDARMKLVLDMVNLWDRRQSEVATYSGGMKRRLEIARGLLHAPRVLFLDEPTVGLDPQTRTSIWEYINDLKQREDITIFLTTHYMDEAENCDRRRPRAPRDVQRGVRRAVRAAAVHRADRADPLGERGAALAGRRVHVLHRPDHQGHRVDGERPQPGARHGLQEREVASNHGGFRHRPRQLRGSRSDPGVRPRQRPAAEPARGQHRLAPGDHPV